MYFCYAGFSVLLGFLLLWFICGFGWFWWLLGWLVAAGVLGVALDFWLLLLAVVCVLLGLVSLVYWNDGVPVWVLVWVAVAGLGWCGG